jgi:hypothetical protein
MSILCNMLQQRGKSPRLGWDAILRWRTLIFFLLLCGFLIPLWTIKYALNISSLAHLSIPSLALTYNDYCSPYSFDATENHTPRWMTYNISFIVIIVAVKFYLDGWPVNPPKPFYRDLKHPCMQAKQVSCLTQSLGVRQLT